MKGSCDHSLPTSWPVDQTEVSYSQEPPNPDSQFNNANQTEILSPPSSPISPIFISTAMSQPNSQPNSLYFGNGSNLWLLNVLPLPKRNLQRNRPSKNLHLDHQQTRLRKYLLSISTRRSMGNGIHSYCIRWGASRRGWGEPHAHTKEMLEVDYWPGNKEDLFSAIDVKLVPQKREMLVYIDRERKRTNSGRNISSAWIRELTMLWKSEYPQTVSTQSWENSSHLWTARWMNNFCEKLRARQ